ncbi:MAG: glutamate--tRNA ligase, partial [Flavobacteriaceae bacterium]|nr:glutamate--tRNA ligase [Flavobacteriaceae bacterium]
YMQQKTPAQLSQLFLPILKEKGITPDLQQLERIVGMIQERCEFVKDIWAQAHFFFQAPESYDEKTVKSKWKADTGEKLQVISELFATVTEWKAESIKEAFSAFMTSKEWGFGAVMVPIRLALVGGSSGPDLFEICELIGKEETIARIGNACEKIVLN